MDTLSKGFKGIVGFLGLTDGDTAEQANDFSHATSPPLPAHSPWASSPSTSPRRPAASVDLTHDIYESDLLPDIARPRLERHPHDGKRRNSVATPVPDPARGYQGPRAMKKPGAGKGLQPINTLNGNAIADRLNPSYGRKPTTYAKTDRNAKSIGRQRYGGQEAYLARNPYHRAATSSDHSVPYASPAKRRKIENSNATLADPVDIGYSDEDEIQLVAPSARQTSTPRPPSNFSSQSPHSTTSRHSGRSSKPASQPTSEFTNTSNFLAPKRSKPRRKDGNGQAESRRASQAEVPSLGAGSQAQEQPISVVEDDVEAQQFPRLAMFQNFKQGVQSKPLLQESPHTDGRVTSKHFNPGNHKMRINESTAKEPTAQTYERIVKEKAVLTSSVKNLRDYRHAEYASEIQNDPIDGSEDELAQMIPNTSKQRRRQSPSRTGHKGGGLRQQTEAASKCYRLTYARTYDLILDSEDLQLKQDKLNPKHFRITSLDSEGNVETLQTVDLGRVNRSDFDNLNRIRLLGPAIHGNRYWFDLQFANNHEFAEFRFEYVARECLHNVVTTNKRMIDFFKKPLQRNDKIGMTPMVNEESHVNPAQDRQQAGARSTVLGTLRNTARDGNKANASHRDGSRQLSEVTQAPVRSVRSTRSRAPVNDQDIFEQEEELNKYSMTVGLGEPWRTQLDYRVERGFLKRRSSTLSFDDLFKLDEGAMLNDSLVNFYMLYLYDELEVSVDRVYFFNTYFFPKLTKKGKGRDVINYDDVKTWTKRDDVFSYDYIVVPINENYHWYLAIICNVSNIKRRPAIDDLQEDSQDLDQTIASLGTSEVPANTNNDPNAEGQGITSGLASVPEKTADVGNIESDDANLFEEEKELNLIDREAKVADERQRLTEEQYGPGERTAQDETTTAALSSTHPDRASLMPVSSQAKQASRRKGKLKSGLQKKDPEKPVIMILDSLCGTHSNATRALREWLQAEGLEKRGMTVEIDNKGHYPKASQIPMQTNFSDCGLYVLGYARKFFADPDEFRKKLLQQQMSAESDWPEMNPSKMRDDIRNVIFRLHNARKEAKKAKRTAKSKDAAALPTKAESKEASPAVQQPSAAEPEPSSAAPAPTEKEPSPAATPAEVPTPQIVAPRLGSPFAPEVDTSRSRSTITQDAEANDKGHASPTIEQSPNPTAETPSARLEQPPIRRTKSPEVRVPTKSLHIDLSSYERYDGANDRSERPTQHPADLKSPPQDSGLRSTDDGKLRKPSARKAEVSSPLGPSRHRPVPRSPPQERTRPGSHDDPITLDDSQDLDAPARKQPRSAKKAQPEVIELDRSQESVTVPARRVSQTQSPPVRQGARQHVLNRDDSIQEVVGHEWQEQHDITRALKRSLADERKRPDRQTNNPPFELEEPMEDVFDAQAAYSRSSHTVQEVPETQSSEAMDLDEVPETPKQQRSSPRADIEMRE